MSLVLWLFLFFLLVIASVLMAFLTSSIRVAWLSVPYVPASRRIIQRMVALATPQPNERMIDLGSGDGRVVLAFARAGVWAEGVELQRTLVWWSRLRLRLAGFSSPQARVSQQSFWEVDLAPYQIVTFYALPSLVARLQAKLDQEIQLGTRVISYAFPLPDWQPVEVRDDVYLYVK